MAKVKRYHNRRGKPMTARQRNALRKAQLASARKRTRGGPVKTLVRARRSQKILKTTRKVKRVDGYIKADFGPGKPLHGSGLHHSVARRQTRRKARLQKLRAKQRRR